MSTANAMRCRRYRARKRDGKDVPFRRPGRPRLDYSPLAEYELDALLEQLSQRISYILPGKDVPIRWQQDAKLWRVDCTLKNLDKAIGEARRALAQWR